MAKIKVSFRMEAEEIFIDKLVDSESTLMYDILDRAEYPEITGIRGEVSRLGDTEVTLVYEMDTEDSFAKNYAKKWEHHLDYIIPFDMYPGIKSVYGCEVVEVE